MHLPNILLASALTLAPAVYGYGVATVDIAYHEACHNGEAPNNSVDNPESTVVTKDTCAQVRAKHSFEIDAYSFSVTPVTKDTTYVCHAVGIYTNDECVGLPISVIPLFPEKNEAKTPCISDSYFDKNVSLKLYCEDDKDDDHEEHGHGPKHGKDNHEDVHDNDHNDTHEAYDKDGAEYGTEDADHREMQTPEAKPKDIDGILDGVNL